MLLPSIKIELCAAGKNEIRNYLQGVYFDVDRKLLTASDGHQFMRIHCEPERGDVTCIIPVTAFATARKMSTKKGPAVYLRTEAQEAGPARVIVTNGLTESRFSAIEGRFPDVDRVIPTADVAMSIGLNAELLAKMQKAVCNGAAYQSVRIDIVDNFTAFRIVFQDPDVDAAVLTPVRL